MIKSILAVSEGGPEAAMAFRLAAQLGRSFGAAVDAVHYPPSLRNAAAGMIDSLGGSSVDWADRRLQARVSTSAAAFGVELSQVAGASFIKAESADLEDLLARARTTDLMVVGRPGADPDNETPATVSIALHESGCPVIVAPPGNAPTGFDDIVIAWNGSQQAARAVRFSLPLLKNAKAVTILVVGADENPIDTARPLAWLARHGIVARTVSIDPGAVSARARGRALLGFTHDRGAGLLVMGAYGNTSFMEFLGLGGATAKVISACRVPVLLAH